MQASRSILQRFGWDSGRRALPSTLRAARSIQRPPIWLREPLPTVVTRGLPHQLTARSFSTSPAARQEPTYTASPETQPPRQDIPSYEIRFTCKKCMTSQTHRMSKQAYHHGTVLVTCPGCKNRHLVADHLKIFSDDRITLEDILKQNGELLRRGTISADGNVEFWEDGTTSEESPPLKSTKPLRIEAEPPKSIES